MILAVVRPHRRTWSGVVAQRRPPESDLDAGFLAGVSTGELHRRAWLTAPATCDLDLRTANVELRPVVHTRIMESKTLSAEKVLPRRSGSRQRKSEVLNTPVVHEGCPPDGIGREVRRRERVDLEPVSVALVLLGRVGCLTQVDLLDARVAPDVADAEADLRAGGDLDGLRLGQDVIVDAAVVADYVAELDVFDGAVAVLGAADVLVGGRVLSLDDNGLEVPVGEDGG
jgi:hypothetical protein